ncbi:hypothetical protein [Thermanaerovibrio acidaminovorans]|jgi:hypothetical protein|uniref:Uncharacterized protein n=1 Tax=Thermanaerovibrio acidaminovorans (strain ATCC 49978 / DSM 6589 / Su883) TaxID=525903 RepID=D1B895_THEAS|nr:hypothetical protein [Thermanaerovibrio acidaminovorans]ACZ18498.1 hypothetical protein Taci_0261 [Thermanaerovibrio acidaminovorans DSM 6589]
MSLRSKLSWKLRQLLYPEELRLPEPEFDGDQLDTLEELIQLIQPALISAEDVHRRDKRDLARFLAELGTGVWRVKKKVEAMKRVPKEIKEAIFALESTWESMASQGVQLIDHVGEVPLGMVPKVVQVVQVPGLEREMIVEALRPTIMLKGEVIQVGEVILGRPGGEADGDPA